MKAKILKFIELSKWFNRKSQHYILGDWLEYTQCWDYDKGTWNAKYFNYIKGYPRAWCRFMWLCRRDILSAKN